MNLVKKGAGAAKAAPAKAKAKTAKPQLSATERVKEMMRSRAKVSYAPEDVFFDPNEPLASANTWVNMPHPWHKLTGTVGLPFGQIITVQGKPDSGKTTLGMHGMVESQQQGYNVVLIDTEHKFNFKRLHNMGFNVKELLYFKCKSIEDGFDAMEAAIDDYQKVSKNTPTLIMWDSLGLTPTEEEMKGTSRSHTVASAAKVIKKNLRRLRYKIAQTNTCVLFINQVYDNINALFGNSTKGYGGNGAYYASSLVMEVQRIRSATREVNKKKIVVGSLSAIKCTKNHLGDHYDAKFEVVIGSLGIETGSIKELKTESLEDLLNSAELNSKTGVGDLGGINVIDDTEDLGEDTDLGEADEVAPEPLNKPSKIKNGRVAAL